MLGFIVCGIHVIHIMEVYNDGSTQIFPMLHMVDVCSMLLF